MDYGVRQRWKLLSTMAETLNDQLTDLPVDSIRPGRYQPRLRFPADRLAALCDSIGEVGIRQRILVRQIDPGEFELVSGERRWRCAQLLGLDRVPVVIRAYDDEKQVALDAGAENSQRDDLDLIERAQYALRLREEHGATNEEIRAALEVGGDASNVTHLVNLLELPSAVQDYLAEADLSMGHGKALRRVKDSPTLQLLIARAAVKRDWTVRKVEAAVRATLPSVQGTRTEQARALKRFLKRSVQAPAERSGDYERIAQILTEQISYRVTFGVEGKDWRSGCIQIHFNDLDELDGILGRIKGADPSVF